MERYVIFYIILSVIVFLACIGGAADEQDMGNKENY